MMDFNKLNKRIDQYYLFNKDTGNDCLLKHVETVEEAKSFFVRMDATLNKALKLLEQT